MGAFSETNKTGMEFEYFLVDDILKKTDYSDTHIDHDNRKFEKWDIWVAKGIEIEAKNDVKAHHESTNICIEIGQYSLWDDSWSLSGIRKTEAKFWAHATGIEYEDCIIYLAYCSSIRNLVDTCELFYAELDNAFLEINKPEYSNDDAEIMKDRFLNDSKIKYGEMYKYLYPKKIDFKYRCYVPQGPGQDDKPMDLCLIPNDIFPDFCLEFKSKYNLTYKDLK